MQMRMVAGSIAQAGPPDELEGLLRRAAPGLPADDVARNKPLNILSAALTGGEQEVDRVTDARPALDRRGSWAGYADFREAAGCALGKQAEFGRFRLADTPAEKACERSARPGSTTGRRGVAC